MKPRNSGRNARANEAAGEGYRGRPTGPPKGSVGWSREPLSAESAPLLGISCAMSLVTLVARSRSQASRSQLGRKKNASTHRAK
eukprot:10056421-Alexandrium_andersonii.AAC.1